LGHHVGSEEQHDRDKKYFEGDEKYHQREKQGLLGLAGLEQQRAGDAECDEGGEMDH